MRDHSWTSEVHLSAKLSVHLRHKVKSWCEQHTHTAADTATNGDVSHPPGADYSLLTGGKMNHPLLCHWLWKGDRSSGRDKHTQVSLQDTAFGLWRRTFSNCHTNKNKCWEFWREVIRSKNAMGAQEGDTVFVYLLDLFRGECGNVEDLLRLLQTHPGDAGGCGRLLRWLTPGLRCCLAGCKKKKKKQHMQTSVWCGQNLYKNVLMDIILLI